MGSESLLQAACELAFNVAREDAEASIEPPGDMRSFLYLARLPRRAIAVAQQAIEDDADFRSRVAARATEDEVGRAGYLWLHRPMGWAPEFEELTRHVAGGGEMSDETTTDGQPSGEIRIATVSPIRGSLEDEPPSPPAEFESVQASNGPGLASVSSPGPASGAPGDEQALAELDSEADAIESELTSLRGLVDRLAGEREMVLASPAPEETAPTSIRFEDELMELRSDLESARHELAIAQSDLAVARQEREEARRLQSEALKRQVDLERQLSNARDDRAGLEAESSEIHASLMALEDRLRRADSALNDSERERDSSQSQLEAMTVERNQLREDRSVIKAERDDLERRLEEVREQTGGVDIGELTSSNRSLTQELESTSRELARLMAQVENFEEQLRVSSSRGDTLKTEKIEVTSRLADTELALETTRTQHEALKVDSERLAADVGTLRAERDSLQTQLSELQESLSDVLSEQAESRARNDADRKSLNELRVERDVLLARMNDIEQADRNFDAKIISLTKERDDLVSMRDELINERGQLRGEAAAASSTRSQMQTRIDELESRMAPMETELQAERRQREELATRLLELDDMAADSAKSVEDLTGERDELRSTVERLQDERVDANQLRVDRDNLQERLKVAERRLEEESDRHKLTIMDLQEQVGTLEGDRTGLEQRFAETQGELTGLRQDYEETSRELARLRVKAEKDDADREGARVEAERQRGELEDRIEALESEKQSLNTEIGDATRLSEDIERQKMELERQRDRAEERRVDAERRRAEAESARDLALRDRDRVETEYRRIEQELIEAQSSLSIANSNLEAQARRASAAKAEAESLAVNALVGDESTKAPAPVEELDPAPTFEEAAPTVEAEAPVVEADEDNQVEADTPVADDGQADTPVAEEPAADALVAEEPAGEPVAEDPVEPVIEEAPADEGVVETPSAEVPSVFSDQEDAQLVEPPADFVVGDTPAALGFDTPADYGAAPVVDMDEHRVPSALDGSAGSVSNDDDLDEISKLISETVTGFDSNLDQAPTDEGSYSVGLAPPSVFSSEDDGAAAWSEADAGRRRIDIPSDIYEDEVAVAQFVVSSPDVVLLVDGDAVADLGWPSHPVTQQRAALVTYLADLANTSGANPDVVFDGRLGDAESLPASRVVRIRLSTPPTEPGAALDELVSAYPGQWPIALVTDDPELAASAEARGATVLNNGQLLDLFIAQ